MGTILGYPLPCPYGVMYLEDGCRITRFEEKPRIPEYPINAGYYVFEPEVLDSLPDRGAMESTAFPKIAEMGRMYCYIPDGIYWSDVGTHKDLENAEKDVSSGKLVLQ
jgi:NDP-sugar pyrophosphorylase family protein